MPARSRRRGHDQSSWAAPPHQHHSCARHPKHHQLPIVGIPLFLLLASRSNSRERNLDGVVLQEQVIEGRLVGDVHAVDGVSI
uniref:Uncharacterized protein n=1 Tax=Arundo donax TaxID=35708 RepID=A0A0A8Y1K7_ARUDO